MCQRKNRRYPGITPLVVGSYSLWETHPKVIKKMSSRLTRLRSSGVRSWRCVYARRPNPSGIVANLELSIDRANLEARVPRDFTERHVELYI